jgi:hypothetical protein
VSLFAPASLQVFGTAWQIGWHPRVRRAGHIVAADREDVPNAQAGRRQPLPNCKYVKVFHLFRREDKLLVSVNVSPFATG